MSKVKTQLVIEGKNQAGGAFKQADSQLTRLSKQARAAGTALAAVFAAGAGAAELARRSAEAVTQMQRMADLSGTSVETFQQWQFAAKSVGFESEKLGDIFKDVQDKIGDFLQNGGGPMKDFFDNIAPQVGVTAERFRNLSGPEALQLYVSSLEQANLSQSEMTFYMEAIANDAALLVPLLRNGGEEFSRLAKRAEEFGFIVSSETAVAAKQFSENMDTLGLVGESVSKRLMAEMLPAMNDLTGLLLDLARDSGVAEFASNLLGGALKVLATSVIAVSATFGNLGRAIGASAAAAAQAARGNFSAAAQIMREMTADNTRATEEAEERIRKLWDGTYAEAAKAAADTAREMRGVENAARTGTLQNHEAISQSYKDLVRDAKSALRDLVREEKAAQKEIEGIRDKSLEVANRYAEAIVRFNSGSKGEPSYKLAQDLRIAARQALAAGNAAQAQQMAQAALEVLRDLEQAGENTYGFAGFARELQRIEEQAVAIEKTEAEQKLQSIQEQIKSLGEQIEAMEQLEISPSMDEVKARQLVEQMKALSEQIGQQFKDIEITFKYPDGTVDVTAISNRLNSPPGFATGGQIRGPGTGTSDSILIRASNGEYMIKAAAVRKYGTALLDQINGMRLPKFADGGLIGSINPPTPGTPLNLTLDGRTYGLSGDSSTIEELARAVRTAKLKRR